ncbi:phage major tail tube protein [Methylobacterium sp. J-070]|uniref:phage major tail tube protein n=1 Tax=Methylobacterium sp. J-070 TaxID=2836650 RepID=UPI001FB9026B|nr:phage major tail tube protein [Methylobacterium sp. J-070]MCJ2054271.1 phage major tail tube protein [Methylobacterium sp. J-070]
MDNVIRGGNWWWSQLNAWRVLEEVEMPEIAHEMDKFAGSGHHMGVEWPEDMNPLTASVKHRTNDPQVRGLCGRVPPNYIETTYYENLESYRPGGTPKGRTVLMRGLLNAVKSNPVRGVKRSDVDYTFGTIVYYHDLFDGRSVHRFDYFGGPGQTLVDGVSPFAHRAQNLAIAGGTVL